MNSKLLIRVFIGELKRVLCKVKLFIFKIEPPKHDDNNNIVVSLTSYGRRVTKTVPYVLYDLLFQSLKPSRIVLWLSKDEFTYETIPCSLKRLI